MLLHSSTGRSFPTLSNLLSQGMVSHNLPVFYALDDEERSHTNEDVQVNFAPAILMDQFDWGSAQKKVGFTNYYTNIIHPTLWQQNLSKVDLLYTSCANTLNAFKEAGFDRPIKRILPPLDLDFWASTLHIESPTFNFLSFASLEPVQGLDVLLEAYIAEFNSQDPVQLIIRCNKRNPCEPSLDLEFWIQEVIKVLDKTQPPTIHIVSKWTSGIQFLYGGADAVISCARYECVGYSILEALAANRKVICPTHSAFGECRQDILNNGYEIPSEPLNGRYICDGSKGPFDMVKVGFGDTWHECEVDAVRMQMRAAFDDGKLDSGHQNQLTNFARFDHKSLAKGFHNELLV